MALLDYVSQEGDDTDEDSLPSDEASASLLGSGGGISEEEMKQLGQTSDLMFGPGKFVPNQFGSRTFIPQDQLLRMAAEQNRRKFEGRGEGGGEGEGAAQLPPTPQATRPSQITSLQQLGAVAKALTGVPDEIKTKIISYLLGLPYEDKRTEAMRAAIQQAQLKRQMEAPERQLKQQQAQESLELRRQSQQNLEQQRQQQNLMQKALMQFRREGRSAQQENRNQAIKLHREMAKNTITNSIANLTRAMEATLDPQQKIQLGKLLQQQHKLYQKFNDLDEGDADVKAAKEAAGGEGSEY
jgi:hypothetical protein